MNILAITQARSGSSRLPNKVLMKINDVTLLEFHINRILQSKKITSFVLATTDLEEDKKIVDIAFDNKWDCFCGNEYDVLDRFYQASKKIRPDYIVRLTSDCPLIDPIVIDQVIDFCITSGKDYVSNTLNPSFPDGMDVEVFRFSALEKAWAEAKLSSEREHVTSYIWKNSSFFKNKIFSSDNFYCENNFSNYRLTVDQIEDFSLIEELILYLGPNKTWEDYVEFLIENPTAFNKNSFIKRNEGYMKSLEKDDVILRHIDKYDQSNEYREKIHDLIPGGAHTYSKGDDQFPEISPAAIAYGKGSKIWDIDGNEFLDCSMGLASVGLGHAYPSIIDRVKLELDKGVNFQRPSVIEKEIAEKFLELIPQHDMVKFSKNGSIVTTAAIKLARAKTKRKLVAFPEDHPFYSYDDWFIGKTECNRGVPDEVKGLSVTFKSCDINSLEKLFLDYPGQIACVITEPERSALGDFQFGVNAKIFLEHAIDLAHKHGTLFILDEMISGYKSSFPGTTTKFNLKADMTTWGKGIANGFSFCALTGVKEVMELGGIRNEGSEKVFLISTTHGGETHGLAAGLACVEEYKEKGVVEHNWMIGGLIIEKCQSLILKYNLNKYITIIPNVWQVAFIFSDEQSNVSLPFRTLFMQEMISRGVLFQGVFIPCFSHSKDDVEYFVKAFEESLLVYELALKNGVGNYLKGKSIKPVFRKIL